MAKLNTSTARDTSIGSPVPMIRTVQTAKGLPKKGTFRNSRWFFASHPERWVWDDTAKAILPSLKQVSLTPGSMGAGNSKQPGQISHEDHVVASWAALGWDAIKPGDPRLGDWAEYAQGWPLLGGGMMWLPKWVTPHLIGKRVKLVVDDEMRVEFLSYLVEKNIIQPMDDVIRDEMITVQRRRLTKIEQDYLATPNALIASRMEANRIKLAQMLGEDEDTARVEVAQTIEALDVRAKALKEDAGLGPQGKGSS